MMVDDTENNEFRELLSDYAAPIEDDGFADRMVMQVGKSQNKVSQNITSQNHGLIKNIMIGGAALIAAFIAVPQLGKLKQLIAGIRLPEFSLPSLSLDGISLESAGMSSLTIFALLAVLIIGTASTYLFGDNL